jgi:hypothetical protein
LRNRKSALAEADAVLGRGFDLHRKDITMTGPISRNRLLGSLKEAASWPGADRNTVVTLATSLVAARADAEGSSYFQDLSERNPADATAQALAGFFAVRAGHDVAAALTKLDKAATMDLGLPQYFRGLALAGLLPGAGPPGRGLLPRRDRPRQHASASTRKHLKRDPSGLELPADLTVLVGENGSGTSTVVEALAAAVQPAYAQP